MEADHQTRGTSKEIQNAAEDCRKHLTTAEKILWEHLRNRQLDGLKFRRQHPVGRFILDFFCPQIKLAVEIDGECHKYLQSRHRERSQILEISGIQVIRFTNRQVVEDIRSVILEIRKAAATSLK